MRKANDREQARIGPIPMGSDLNRVDRRHSAGQYEELPELTDEMVARGTVNRGGGPSQRTRKLISIRLTEDVIQRWRATGPG